MKTMARSRRRARSQARVHKEVQRDPRQPRIREEPEREVREPRGPAVAQDIDVVHATQAMRSTLPTSRAIGYSTRFSRQRGGSPPVPCLEQQRSARAGVRAVAHAGRTARVHARAERAAEPEVLEAALDDQDLLPEVVLDGLGGTDAGREAEQAREVAGGRMAAQDVV